MLAGIVALDQPPLANEVSTFLGDHPVPQGEKQIEQHLETLRINVSARLRETERFSAWITS